jgi:hypothetical protein
MLANGHVGIQVGSNCTSEGWKSHGNYVWNNTIAGCDEGLHLILADSTGVKNNIIYNSNDPIRFSHAPTNTTWGGNIHYPSRDPLDASATEGDPRLARTSGWNSLATGELNEGDFSIQQGSAAMNAGEAVICTQEAAFPAGNDTTIVLDDCSDPQAPMARAFWPGDTLIVWDSNSGSAWTDTVISIDSDHQLTLNSGHDWAENDAVFICYREFAGTIICPKIDSTDGQKIDAGAREFKDNSPPFSPSNLRVLE